MGNLDRIVLFSLEGWTYGLWLGCVERVLRSVEVTPLPECPEVILGVVDVEGEIVPVADPRTRFHLPRREIGLHDHFMLVRTAARRLILPVDRVMEVAERPPSDHLQNLGYLEGVVVFDDGVVLIQDLDAFLSLEEEQALAGAMAAAAGGQR